jgi:GNAT superfamily N-acetyltransferase
MPDKLSPDRIAYEKLSEKHLDIIRQFENQEKDLVDFLLEDALDNQNRGISVTYLFFYLDEGRQCFGGYITLLSDSVEIKQNKDLKDAFEGKGIMYRTLPALKIGRMATDKRCQGKGVGTSMIKFAITTAFEQSKGVGCRFLIVDAKKGAEEFYLKKGFKVFIEHQKEPRQMYLDLYLK